MKKITNQYKIMIMILVGVIQYLEMIMNKIFKSNKYQKKLKMKLKYRVMKIINKIYNEIINM